MKDVAKQIDDLPGVTAGDPLSGDYPLVSDDRSSTIIQVRFTSDTPSDGLLAQVTDAGTPDGSSGLETWVGGDAYGDTSEPSRVPELLGLLVSYLILAVTFRSLLAAGMPILSSLIGVGVTLSSIVLFTSLTTVSSSAPTLAEMLGLAVGIDYALFILSRYRRHLGEGHAPTEAMSRALVDRGQRRRVRRGDRGHRADRPDDRPHPGADRDGTRRGRCRVDRRHAGAHPAAGGGAAAG